LTGTLCIHIYVLRVLVNYTPRYLKGIPCLYKGCLYTCIHTGWRRVIGCLIFQVIFHQRALGIVALLRTMTCNLRHPISFCHFALRGFCRVLDEILDGDYVYWQGPLTCMYTICTKGPCQVHDKVWGGYSQ